MSSPEPTYRPHLVETEVVEHHGNAAEELWNERAREHNTRQRVAEMRRQVAEEREHEHEVYVDECRRLAERIAAENALTAARWPAPGPVGVSARVQDTVQDVSRPVPDPVEAVDEDDSLAATLDERAAALFRTFPDVSRDKAQAILRCNSYRAKTLRSEQPRGAR